MATLPLGIGAYKRASAGEPEVRLENRYVEANPTNLREKIALLARPGTNGLDQFAGGKLRGNYSKQGLFGGDLFTVSGSNLYRRSADGTKTQIVGLINGSGHPNVAWMKGEGYEYLFIADGLLLQFYDGGSRATGTLTKSGAITNQVVRIGSTYYTWDAAVDGGSPDGTSAKPWRAKLGGTDAESLANLAKLINFDGVRGVDFTTALGGPSPLFTATSTPTTLLVKSISVYADANSISTTIFSGASLVWGSATLTGGGVHALSGVPVPDGLGVKALAAVSGYVLASIALSQRFYWLEPGNTTIDPLNFATKESNPDNIVDMLTVGDQVLICGNGSAENWYATGDPLAPFAPVEGRVYQRGVVEGTAVVVKDSVILVGDDAVVYEIGYQAGSTTTWGVHRISNHGIEERLRMQLRREQGVV